jgi:hypothetical protein
MGKGKGNKKDDIYWKNREKTFKNYKLFARREKEMRH